MASFVTVHTAGALLPLDVLERVASLDSSLGGQSVSDYQVEGGQTLNERISYAFNRAVALWATFVSAWARLPKDDPASALTRERWLLPLLRELGWRRLAPAEVVEIDEKRYPVSHEWQACPCDVPVPVHLLGAGIDLETRTKGTKGAATRSPHSLMQELLNRSPARIWGLLSNGRTLRLLRDNASFTRQAFVEFDLERMMEERAYDDFRLFWLLCHASRFEAPRADDLWVEKWSRLAQAAGVRALDRLREGVQRAIEAMGRGFLQHPANHELRERLHSEALKPRQFYRQLLRLAYRVIFLCAAEDRTYDCEGRPRSLLLRPDASEEACARYGQYYSTGRLRRLAARRRGSRHGDLYAALRVVMERLGSTEGGSALGLPALGSFLWAREAVPDVATAELSNRHLLQAVRCLSVTREGDTSRTVDFRNLGAEELGSVYESLLELEPQVSDEQRDFALSVAGGNERKSTGSWYTPTSLILCLLEVALDPALEDASRDRDAEKAILGLKILDPACGSGHFLIAAAHRMAHRLASVRTGDEEAGPLAVRRALREVISHCIYGVDLNEMAVELCKISLWMDSLDPGLPLSFLENRIICGNSLLGATPTMLVEGIPDIAFSSERAELRTRNREERIRPEELWPAVARPWRRVEQCALELNVIGEETIGQLAQKEQHFERCAGLKEHGTVRTASDAWCAAFVPDAEVTNALVGQVLRGSSSPLPPLQRVRDLSDKFRFHHWYLVFPDVLRLEDRMPDRQDSPCGWVSGFDVILGNPPYLRDSRKGDVPPSLLKKLYASAVSHYDLCILFIELAMNLLAPRGRLALITSNGWLRQKYGKAIRHLLTRRQMTHLIEVDYLAFDAGVRTCITGLRNAPATDESRTTVVWAKDPSDLQGLAGAPSLPLSTLRSAATFSLETLLRTEEATTYGEDRFVRLGDLAFVTLGMVFNEARPGGKRKSDYLSRERIPPFLSPLLDGEHVERWRANGLLWLDYQPTEHREPRFAELYGAPAKILCRRIVGKASMMAYLDQEQMYFSDNVVGVVPFCWLETATARAVRSQITPQAIALSREFDPWFLLGLLNSATLTAHFRTEQGGGTHFYSSHAKGMPVPRISLEEQQPVAQLARRIQSLARDARCSPEFVEGEHELDRMVAALYEQCGASREPVGVM